MTSEPRGRLLPVHDTDLRVIEQGPEDGLVVLAVGPGVGERFAALASSYRLVVVETREGGATDPASWTDQQHASDLSAVAAALGVEQYAVLGHGPGARIAAQHAIDGPGAAIATVLSDAGGVPTPDASQPVLVCDGDVEQVASFLRSAAG